MLVLAHGSAPALRDRLGRGEGAEAVQVDRGAERRRRAGAPLPGIGESGGGAVFGADPWEPVTEVGQAVGEAVGLLGVEGVTLRRFLRVKR